MTAARSVSDDFAQQRLSMIDGQIRPNRVTDPRILSAFLAVARERFVPQGAEALAYSDTTIALSADRVLLSPMVFARLVQELNIRAGDKILDVAPGLGYSSAILSHLAGQVVALEENVDFADQMRHTLAVEKIANVSVLNGRFETTITPEAPFDIVLLNVGAEVIPPLYFEQLRDGGQLAAIVLPEGRAANRPGEARIYHKKDGQISFRTLFEAQAYVPSAFKAPTGFSFQY
jgi:protein-L-isoaspartate(D-aspartate) O-methyltransferase